MPIGSLTENGMVVARAGFMPGSAPAGPMGGNAVAPLFSRIRGGNGGMDLEALTQMEAQMGEIQRGEFTGNVNEILARYNVSQMQFQRGILSSQTAFPVRENLEAPARLLVPVQTPLRNRLARTPGSGKASAWKQIVSLGGGYATTSTTVTSGTASATQAVGSTAGWAANDVVYIAGATKTTRTISSVTNATTVVFTTTVTTTTGDVTTNVTQAGMDQPGSATVGAIQAFFAENGAPGEHTTVYADKSASYKLLGTYGSVSIFAASAGATFDNQIETEKTNAIRNLMLNEENALVNGSSTDVNRPWGDGTSALGFDGILNLATTANGVPAAQVQTAVGVLTTGLLDGQLERQWVNGAEGPYMLMNGQEILSLTNLAQANGSIIRVMAAPTAEGILGFTVTGYKHPITGDIVQILPSRFLQKGTIFFGADRLPDGSPAMDVDVLPQVSLPALAPNEQIQGYTAQEIAPTTTAPQILPFLVSVFETLRMKGATVFGKVSGVLPAA